MITPYRLVSYVLGAYLAVALVFAGFGRLLFGPVALLVSIAVLLVSTGLTDLIMSHVYRLPRNYESWLLSALIMACIIQPAGNLSTGLALVAAGIVAGASKYIITWRGAHIFNPAALAAAVVSLGGLQATTWWIGNSAFGPLTLLLGLLVVRTVRRWPLVLTFIAVSVVLQGSLQGPVTLLASPLFFLATIMLTEPATMPGRRRQQIMFAAIAGVLYAGASRWIYPEVALLLANLYAFVVSPHVRVRLELTKVHQISDRVYTYIFRPDRPLAYLPGQYMAWTLADVPFDRRGNRRSLTIASSPTEADIQVGITYATRSSAYKRRFAQLQPGDVVYGSQVAGSFVIDPQASDKLAFIAGGIGITPFRSMAAYCADMGLERDVVLLYVVPDEHELAYLADFERAGIRVLPVIGRLSQEQIAQLVPDYDERTFYVAGPPKMVQSSRRQLRKLGVPRRKQKTDYFSGY